MLKLIEKFQKDAQRLGRDRNSIEEFKIWLEAEEKEVEVESDEVEAEIWYDTATEDEITHAIRSLGWKPYKFQTASPKDLEGGTYPTWDELGKGYLKGSGDELRKELIQYVKDLRSKGNT